jgi:hypothetical protein
MASIIVLGFIRIEIPDGSNVLFGEKVFEEKKLSEVCDIACVSVLQRGCFKALVRKEIGSNRLFPKLPLQ